MELYNEIIDDCMAMLAPYNIIKYPAKAQVDWKLETTQKIIFRNQMAYELGGNNRPALSGLCFTNEDNFENEVWLVGEDLSALKEDSAYARITIINVDDSSWSDSQKAYASMQKIDYTRYHIYPEGFMMRISTSSAREPVRISAKALAKGLDFQKAGNLFINGYLKQPYVKGAKIIFITEQKFEYEILEKYVSKMTAVTNSLDSILKNLVMDCRTCNYKPVCDEVEGLREYHMQIAGADCGQIKIL